MNGEALFDYVYCISCMNGRESKLVGELSAILPETTVIISPIIERSEKHNKEWVIFETRLTPGYLFIYTRKPLEWDSIKGKSSFYRVLSYDSKEECSARQKYCLRGSDLSFANWIIKFKGRIELSNVKSVNQRVMVVDGPLSSFDGKIVRIDKHNRKALVVVDFDNTQKKVWLSFNWIDAIEKQ